MTACPSVVQNAVFDTVRLTDGPNSSSHNKAGWILRLDGEEHLSVLDPTKSLHAANKEYVDSKFKQTDGCTNTFNIMNEDKDVVLSSVDGNYSQTTINMQSMGFALDYSNNYGSNTVHIVVGNKEGRSEDGIRIDMHMDDGTGDSASWHFRNQGLYQNNERVLTETDYNTLNNKIADLSGAFRYIGTTTTIIYEGSTSQNVIIGGVTHIAETGDVVTYEDSDYGLIEYVWNGVQWIELGAASNFVAKTVYEAKIQELTNANAALTDRIKALEDAFAAIGTLTITESDNTLTVQ